jgi:VWFA-related protein
MRATLLAIALGVVAGQPTFRTGTTLVEFTVVARDGRDRSVTDLKKDEIAVSEDGASREVAFFRFDGGVDAEKREALPVGFFTNRSEYASGPARNVTAIVIDSINTLPSEQNTLRTQLLHYLATIGPNTRVGVYQIGSRITVLHDLTDDIDLLRARIGAVRSLAQAQATEEQSARSDKAPTEDSSAPMMQVALDEMIKLEMDYQETVAARKRVASLASLEAIASHLTGVPGRKSLVWITEGIPIRTTFRFPTFHEQQIKRTAERLATAGVAVYPVDALGLTPPPSQLSATGRGSARIPATLRLPDGLPDQRKWATMDVMADVTGGRVSKNTNDFTQGIKEAGADLRGAYSIGYYTADERDDGWRRIRVTTTRRGVQLLHRQGYVAKPAGAKPTQWSTAEWRWAIANPLGSTAMHLDARLEPVPNQARTYSLLVLIAPEELRFQRSASGLSADVEIVTAEKRLDGTFEYHGGAVTLAMAAADHTADSVVRYTDRWTVGPETTTIRLIVRDRITGRYGTLDMSLSKLPKS